MPHRNSLLCKWLNHKWVYPKWQVQTNHERWCNCVTQITILFFILNWFGKSGRLFLKKHILHVMNHSSKEFHKTVETHHPKNHWCIWLSNFDKIWSLDSSVSLELWPTNGPKFKPKLCPNSLMDAKFFHILDI